MSYGMTSGALSRGRNLLVRTVFTIAAAVVALLVLSICASNANAAFTANGYTLGAAPTQAGAHPTITLSASNDPVAADANGDDLKSLQFELPAGMAFNPRAVSTPCPTASFTADGCAAATQVGSISVTFRNAGKLTTATGQVYSITPDANSLINFGFIVRPAAATNFQKFSFTSGPVTGFGAVRTSPDADYGLSVPIPTLPRVIKNKYGTNTSITISNLAVTFNPRSGTATSGLTFTPFTHTPTRCTPANSKVSFTSYSNVAASRTASYTPTGCNLLDFDIGFEVTPSYTQVSRPTGFSTTLYVPDANVDLAIQPSHVKELSVFLQDGTTINPSTTLAVTLCTDAQLAADACPAGSLIGDARFDVPFLAAGMSGEIYMTGRTGGVQFAYVVRGERGTKSILRGSFAVETRAGNTSGVVLRFPGLPQVPATRIVLNLTKRMINNGKGECPYAAGWGDIRGTSGNRWLWGLLYPQTGCPPETTITSGPPANTNVKTPAFEFTSPQAGATFECSIDYGTYKSCASGFKPATALADGNHTFGVRAVYEGISDPSPAQLSFTLDTVTPTMFLAYPAAGQIYGTGTITSYFSAEAGAIATCSIDGATPTTCSSPATFAGVTPGNHSFALRVSDLAGNNRTVTRQFKVASPAGPKVTLTAPSSGSTLLSNQLIPQFTVTSPTGTAIASTICKVYKLQFWAPLNIYLEGQSDDTPCASGVGAGYYETGERYRLKLLATDANGEFGIESVDFIPGIPPPGPAEVINDVQYGTLTDRTPTFDLNYFDTRRPNATIECSLVPAGQPRAFTSCGTASNLPDYTPATPLSNGEWIFSTRSLDGTVVGDPYDMSFTIVDWAASYKAVTSTQKAGAHPDLDVEVIPTNGGQLKSVDITLPKGLIGSLNSFPKCADIVTGICPSNTKVGNVLVDYEIAGQGGLVPAPGDVFLTGPQAPGDAAGMVINVYRPVAPFMDVIIPLRIQLTNNAQTMRVFSDSIPTVVGDENEPGVFTNFWVKEFDMHVDGSQGSPYPLLTNPSSCAAGQFSASFGDTEGTKTPAATIPYQSNDCASLPFNPTITQSFTSTTAGDLAGVSANVSIPENNSSFRTLRVAEPAAFGPSFPSFGAVADQCSAAAAPTGSSVFNPSLCPESAKVGEMTIISPLLDVPLEGKVYLINKSPLPWLGVALDGVGISVRLVGVTSLPQVDPSCDPSTSDTGECPSQIVVTFGNLPDLQATNISFSINGPDRTGVGGTTLPGKILAIATPSDPTCVPSDVARTAFTPNSGTPVVNALQTISFTGCNSQ
jgi:hypothetical protein